MWSMTLVMLYNICRKMSVGAVTRSSLGKVWPVEMYQVGGGELIKLRWKLKATQCGSSQRNGFRFHVINSPFVKV